MPLPPEPPDPEEKLCTSCTNNFGDFEFDGPEKGPACLLNIEAEGYYPMICIYLKG